MYNKKSKSKLLLKNPLDADINLAEKNCFSKKIKKVLRLHFSEQRRRLSGDKKFLRVNYDLDSNILVTHNEYQKFIIQSVQL
ncbi:Uncharacterised protein [Rodentibacter pneumotropicus]|uniref:Uncharacterized protein n=1 Tax=Rodentibacter pneumotropicus TaxID=758 RepID=A0A448MJ24_9PAST|nr:Uncharacterised protein [Rodentibacter pneumotropicus]